MATSTPNLNLTLPSSGDRVNVEVLNGNFEKLDDRLGGVSDSIIVDDLDPANLVHVTDAAARPAVELISHIGSYQAGSGWSRLEAVRTGSNLAGVVVPIGIISNTQIQCNSNWRSLEIPVVPGAYYTVARATVNTNVRFRYCFTEAKASVVEGATTSCIEMRAVDSSTSFTAQVPENARYLYVYVDNSGASIDLSRYTVSVGQQAAAYEPYEAQTLTADLPETVYGGTLNWTTGMLVSTLDADGNGLAEPKIIQLTPQQLNILKGVNNVWSNCGETKLVYVADTKKYIDEKFAALAAAQLGV